MTPDEPETNTVDRLIDDIIAGMKEEKAGKA